MNWERLTEILRVLRRMLADAEAGRCDTVRLLGPLWQFTGATCLRSGECAGRTWWEWNERGHALRDAIRFAAETGKSTMGELARVRRVFAPLFAELDRAERCDQPEREAELIESGA